MSVVKIKERFCGPPGTGNGGYVCGLVAGALGQWPAEITLRKPAPVETPLDLELDGGNVRLLCDDAVVADAKGAPLDLDVPPPPTFVEAKEASKGFLGFHTITHPYKGCFVCGMERAPGDGMRIFSGPLEGKKGAATVWTPEEWMCKTGQVRPEFVLGALDCPGYFAAFPDAKTFALLGRMTASIIKPIEKGKDYIVLAWPVLVEGRKHIVGTALFDIDGAVVAKAKSIWITP